MFWRRIGKLFGRPDDRIFRDGCCNTGPQDQGLHTVCAVLTKEFLAFSREAGNDLSTPVPQFGFRIEDGDQWCLCAGRWEQARQGAVPQGAVEINQHGDAGGVQAGRSDPRH